MRAMNTTVAIICCIAKIDSRGQLFPELYFFRQGIAYRQKQAESIMGSAEKRS